MPGPPAVRPPVLVLLEIVFLIALAAPGPLRIHRNPLVLGPG
jgi:hypothetical protein